MSIRLLEIQSCVLSNEREAWAWLQMQWMGIYDINAFVDKFALIIIVDLGKQRPIKWCWYTYM